MSASENGHTPGPWTDDAGVTSDSTVVFAVEELEEEWPSPVADCNDFDGNRPLEERRANARLIAAAPDLLRELRGARCPRPCNNRPDDFEVGHCVDAGECGCSLGAAVSKATGAA